MTIAVPGPPEHFMVATAGVGVGSGDGEGVGEGDGIGDGWGLGATSGDWVCVPDWIADGEGRTLVGVVPHAVTISPANKRAAPRVQAISQA